MVDIPVNAIINVQNMEELNMLNKKLKQNERSSMNIAQMMEKNRRTVAHHNVMSKTSPYNIGKSGFGVQMPLNTVGMTRGDLNAIGQKQIDMAQGGIQAGAGTTIEDISKTNVALDEQVVAEEKAAKGAQTFGRGQDKLRTAQRNFLAVNMSMLGTWFSMMSLMNMASRLFSTIINPLKDLSSAMDIYGMAVAFADDAGFDLNNVMDDQGEFISDVVDSWKILQGTLGYVGVALLDLGTELVKDEDFMRKVNDVINKMVETIGTQGFVDNIEAVATAVLNIASGFMDVFDWVGKALDKLEDFIGEENLEKLEQMAGIVAAMSLVGMPVFSVANLGLSGLALAKYIGLWGGFGAAGAGTSASGAGSTSLIGSIAGTSIGGTTIGALATPIALLTVSAWAFYDVSKRFGDVGNEEWWDKQADLYEESLGMTTEAAKDAADALEMLVDSSIGATRITQDELGMLSPANTSWEDFSNVGGVTTKEINITQINNIDGEAEPSKLVERLYDLIQRESSSFT